MCPEVKLQGTVKYILAVLQAPGHPQSCRTRRHRRCAPRSWRPCRAGTGRRRGALGRASSCRCAISTPTRSWKQIDVRQESKQRESPPRRSSSSPATPRTSQKGVRSTSKGGRSKSPTSAEFRAAIKEKNKMEMEIGEYQKTKCRQQWRIFIKKTMGAPSGSRSWRDDARLPASSRDILRVTTNTTWLRHGASLRRKPNRCARWK